MQTAKRAKTGKRELVTQVIRDAREYSIGMVSFHQAVGRIVGLNVTDMKCLDVMTMRGRLRLPNWRNTQASVAERLLP